MTDSRFFVFKAGLPRLLAAATAILMAHAPSGVQAAESLRVVPIPESARSVDLIGEVAQSGRPGDRTAIEGRLDHALVLAERAALSGNDIRAASSLPDALIDGDRILVEIWHASGAGRAAFLAGLAQLGVEIRHVGDEGPTEAWVPAAQMSTLAALPGVHRVTPARLVKPLAGSENSQGVSAGNAPPWHAAGLDGDGVTVAIIDSYNNTGGQVAALQASGDWPPNSRLTTVKVGGGTFGNNGVNHGNAVLEIAYDVAPGATYIAYDTLTLGDWRSAIQQAVVAGAQVISASLGAPLDGIGDGTALPGSVAQRVEEAAAAGVLYLNAAGNERESHWGGLYNGNGVSPGGGYVDTLNWGAGSNLNLIPFCLPPGFPVQVTLHWDDWVNVNHDYDMFLFRRNSAGTAWDQVASSTQFQDGGAGQRPQEFISFAASGSSGGFGCPVGTSVYAVMVARWNAPTSRNLQLFAPGLNISVPARSLGFPADSPAAITVAALDVGSSIQESYSSEGPILAPGGGLPTGSEFPKPDLASFANVDTVSYGPGVFNGTSAAAPHAAGMAALLMQRHPGFDRDQIAQLMRDISAQGANDLGTAGFDFQHGYGRLRFQQETSLAVTQQPTDTLAGQTISAVEVEIRDSQNLRVLSGPTTNVATAIGNDPSSGAAVLSGTTPVLVDAGTAIFDDLSIDVSGTGYTLDFSAAGLAGAASTSFDVLAQTWTVTPSAGTGGSIDPSTPQSVDHGQTTAFTVTPDTGYSIDTVGGTCGGNLVGNTYTTNAVTADCTVVASFVINTYTVTPSAGTGGSIDPSTPQSVDHGQTTAFTVTPDTGYSIDTVGGTCGGNLMGNTYTTNAVTSDCTVVASFVINTYTVTPSAGTGGSIDPSTPQSVDHGQTTAFTVTPDTGYSIDTVGGTCGGNLVGNTYTTNAVTADCTVVASFVINTYTVTPSAGTGGSIDPSTPQSVDHGQTTAFTVTPDTGYSIDTVGGTCGGNLVGNTFTTNAVTADCTVVASFVINTYTVTPSAGTGGSIDPSTPQSVDHGQTAAFTVTPDTGYSIDTVGGTCGGNLVGNTYTTNAVTADCTVVASFVINTYTVTPSAGTGGSIDPSTPQSVDHGQTTAFTVTPDTGYSIDTVGGTCGGNLVGNTYTTNAVTSDCTVVASFVINTYTVTPSAGTGGSIDPSTPQSVDHGQTTAFTVTPDTGYSIDTVGGTCGGNLVGNTFTTNAVTADCTVVASFVINTYTVTPSSGTGGSIDPSTPQSVDHGQTTAFTVTPDTGYSIDTVGGTCGGNLVGNTYTTNAVTADCTVVASFVINTYTVTPSAGTGGSIDPSTPQSVDHGQTTAFTVTPDTGYSIDTVDGTCGGNLVGNTFTTNAVTADCTVVASFVINTYTVTPSAGTGGSIDPSTPQSVDHGQTTAFTVTPDTGYSIDTVGGTCGGNLVGNTYTTNAVTADCTVVASFVINTYTVTPSAGTGGSIDPSTPQSVDHGQTTAFTVTPDTGFSIDTVGGTCGGNLVGNTYTTNAVTADCTVEASFTEEPIDGVCGPAHGGTFTSAPDTDLCDAGNPSAVTGDGPWSWICQGVAGGSDAPCSAGIQTWTVTPSAGTGGSIDPSTAQTVNHGQTAVFTVTPDSGFSIDTVGGTCGGGLAGDTYTTDAVTADCTVEASFVAQVLDAAIRKRVTHSLVLLDDADLVRFRILVENVGPEDIVGAEVLDLMPVEMTGVSWTCEEIAGGECANVSGVGDIQELVNLPVGAAVAFVVAGRIENLAAGGLANVAVVDVENDEIPEDNTSGALYQRCTASNIQTDPDDENLLEHACVFLDGYEE